MEKHCPKHLQLLLKVKDQGPVWHPLKRLRGSGSTTLVHWSPDAGLCRLH